ncbi:acyltransferase [Microbacterium saccharophilum]|uniref:Acyltransferase n=2 Tax=Microbacterium saccharophilum TaxID=1213358 RepID=A0A5C8I7C5_9MICO|nr:acyltransferase [Microbacterium saccharophilum]GEP47115.1 hypothetical protein MSA03_06230 [Microbacterium saccharophilum]
MRFMPTLRDARAGAWEFLACSVGGSPLLPPIVRRRWLQMLGVDIRNARIKSGVYFGSRRIHIHDGAFINVGVFIDGSGEVTIEENCSIAYNVTFASSGHRIGPSDRRTGEHEGLPITIGRGTWVGANTVILGGVSIGNGCVVAAGSVVTRDCAPNGLYAGAPARRLRDLP